MTKTNLTIDQLTRNFYGNDPDYIEYPQIDDFFFDDYESMRPCVFIYTVSHDGGTGFEVVRIPKNTVPPKDQRMLLKLNSPNLSDEQRYEIYDVIFGPYNMSFSKWTYRTTWNVVIGNQGDFVKHILDTESRIYIECILCKLMSIGFETDRLNIR